MADNLSIRPARIGEGTFLSQLSRRSKAHWGYDSRFMELSREALTIRETWISDERVLVADIDGDPAGVAAIAADGEGFEIAAFFIDPDRMGCGVGARLFGAVVDLAAKAGIGKLGILSDPNAVGFYEKMGACRVSMEPSDAIPGRMLPYLELVV